MPFHWAESLGLLSALPSREYPYLGILPQEKKSLADAYTVNTGNFYLLDIVRMRKWRVVGY